MKSKYKGFNDDKNNMLEEKINKKKNKKPEKEKERRERKSVF